MIVIPVHGGLPSNDEDFSKSSTLQTWNKNETFLLLEVYKKYKPLFVSHKSISVFEFLSKKLLEYDIKKSAKDLQGKFNNLIRSYKTCSKATSKKHTRFQYFDSMVDILNSSTMDDNDNELLELEFQEYEINQKKSEYCIKVLQNQFYHIFISILTADFNTTFKRCDWSECELSCLVKSFLEQLSSGQISWELISENLENIRSSEECVDMMKILLISVKSFFHEKVEIENIVASNLTELYRAFQNEEELDQIIECIDSDNISTKMFWSSAETMKLIELYQKHINLFKKQKKLAGFVYCMSKELNKAGYPCRSYKIIKQKIDNLKRTYKTCFENEAIYFVKPKKFKFYEALKPVFGKYESYWLNGVDPVSETDEKSDCEIDQELVKSYKEVKKRPPWTEKETKILIREYKKLKTVRVLMAFFK